MTSEQFKLTRARETVAKGVAANESYRKCRTLYAGRAPPRFSDYTKRLTEALERSMMLLGGSDDVFRVDMTELDFRVFVVGTSIFVVCPSIAVCRYLQYIPVVKVDEYRFGPFRYLSDYNPIISFNFKVTREVSPCRWLFNLRKCQVSSQKLFTFKMKCDKKLWRPLFESFGPLSELITGTDTVDVRFLNNSAEQRLLDNLTQISEFVEIDGHSLGVNNETTFKSEYTPIVLIKASPNYEATLFKSTYERKCDQLNVDVMLPCNTLSYSTHEADVSDTAIFLDDGGMFESYESAFRIFLFRLH